MTDPGEWPPINRRGRRRRRNRWIAIGAVVTLALVGGGWTGKYYWDAWQAEKNRRALDEARRCPGLDATSGEGFALSRKSDRTGEQCVGWIVERNYPFGSDDQNIVSIVSRITAENQWVREQPGNPSPKPYVRVGVLMPMTSAPGSAMGAGEILHALQGSYAAQMQANHSSSAELGDPTPLVQLVLANEGLDHSSWPDVVEQLGLLKEGAHPLVAVTGLSISIPDTRMAAERLSELEIPSIGAVVTSDDMVAPWLFKVSPSNHQYALALQSFLEQQPPLRTGYLVYDRNPEDNYVRSLRTAFVDTFDDSYALQEHSGGFNGSRPPVPGTPLLFSEIVRDVCAINPEIVFYAGRGRDLPDLISALKGRGHCQVPVRPLIIATGATGLTISQDDLDSAQLGLLDVSCTDPAAWRTGAPGTPAYYAAFHRFFTATPAEGGLGFTEDDLGDGYTIMHRDAVATAVWAARRDAAAKAVSNASRGNSPPISELPTSRDVHYAIFSLKTKRIPGASGDLYFREQPPNDHWPSGKPVPVIRSGALLEPWTTPDTYITE